ncbi:hypothetical protein ACFX2I_040310 [Malus domestica]
MLKSARIEDKDGDFDWSARLLILTTCKSEPVRTAAEKLRSTQSWEELEKMMREKIKIRKIKIRKIDYLPARQVTFPANQTKKLILI